MKDVSKVEKDEINLFEIYLNLMKKKIFIFIFTVVFSILSVVYALSIPNDYKSKTILVPVKMEESLSSRLGSLSTLASISGVNINDGSTSKAQEAIERIKSFNFFVEHFYPYIDENNISAIKGWQPDGDKIIYETSLLNKNFSHQELHEIYLDSIEISQDKVTQFVSVSFVSKSPSIAKEFLDLIVVNINESMRVIDIENAQNAIDYLNETSKSTNVQSLKNAISNLLESQMQILMLASSSDAYIFKTLDPPIVSEKKSSPNRSIISIFGTILGFIFAISMALILNFNKERK